MVSIGKKFYLSYFFIFNLFIYLFFYVIDSKNALGLTPTFNLLKELTLPQIPALLSRKDGDFLKKIALVRRVLGKDIFIGIDVMVDPRNKSRNVIVLDTPSALSPLPG